MTVKRVSLILLMLAIAPLSGFGLEIGAGFGYALSMFNTTEPGNTPFNGTLNLVRGGIFFDADYFRIEADGYINLSPLFSTGNDPTYGHFITLAGSALAKLPVTIGSLKLWTGAGLRYFYALLRDTDGDWVNDGTNDKDVHDLYLALEVGGSYALGKTVRVGGTFMLSYDLIPNYGNAAPAGSESTGLVFEFAAFIGFTL